MAADSRVDDYLETARHSLIYNEDFAPAEWYFHPDLAPYCWGLFSRMAGGVEYLVGFLTFPPDVDAAAVVAQMERELFRRYEHSQVPARLTLVTVVVDAREPQADKLVSHRADSRSTVDVVLLDLGAGRLAAPDGYRSAVPGSRSIGFPSAKAEEPIRREKSEEAAARRYFRERARRSMLERGLPFAKPTVTNILIWMNVAMLAIEYLTGGITNQNLVRLGAKWAPYIARGEYWRLITYQFLHGGILHLAFNGYALFNMGPFIEGAWGNAGFTAIYLLSGAMGGLVSAALTPRTITVGASGAIFGLLGATLTYLLSGQKSWDVIWQVVGYPIVATTLYGLVGGLDNFAHFGGLLGGFLIATALGLGYRIKKPARMAAGVTFVMLTVLLLARL
jgi:membrane associated rhomboid family serine protease